MDTSGLFKEEIMLNGDDVTNGDDHFEDEDSPEPEDSTNEALYTKEPAKSEQSLEELVCIGHQMLETMNRLASSAERIASALEIIAKVKKE